MKKQNNLYAALIDRIDTAWTCLIVGLVLAVMLVMAGLKAARIMKTPEDDEAAEAY